jgi:hypothetical protein
MEFIRKIELFLSSTMTELTKRKKIVQATAVVVIYKATNSCIHFVKTYWEMGMGDEWVNRKRQCTKRNDWVYKHRKITREGHR